MCGNLNNNLVHFCFKDYVAGYANARLADFASNAAEAKDAGTDADADASTSSSARINRIRNSITENQNTLSLSGNAAYLLLQTVAKWTEDRAGPRSHPHRLTLTISTPEVPDVEEESASKASKSPDSISIADNGSGRPLEVAGPTTEGGDPIVWAAEISRKSSSSTHSAGVLGDVMEQKKGQSIAQ